MGEQGGIYLLLAFFFGITLEKVAHQLGVDPVVLQGALLGSAVAFFRGNGPANQSVFRRISNAIGGFWIALYATAGMILAICAVLPASMASKWGPGLDRLIAIAMGTAGIYISDFFTNFARGLSNNGGRFADILTHSAGLALKAMIDRLRPSNSNSSSTGDVDAPDDGDSQSQDGGEHACDH